MSQSLEIFRYQNSCQTNTNFGTIYHKLQYFLVHALIKLDLCIFEQTYLVWLFLKMFGEWLIGVDAIEVRTNNLFQTKSRKAMATSCYTTIMTANALVIQGQSCPVRNYKYQQITVSYCILSKFSQLFIIILSLVIACSYRFLNAVLLLNQF